MIQPFGRGRTGKAKIITHKDRDGYLPRPKAGELELTSDEDTQLITWQIKLAAPDQSPENFRPTNYMERVSRYLESQTVSISRNAVESNVSGKAQYVRAALDALVNDSYAEETPGPKQGAHQTRLYTLLRPYREDEDEQFVPSSPLRPGSSQDEAPNEFVRSSPPYNGDEGERDEPQDEIPF